MVLKIFIKFENISYFGNQTDLFLPLEKKLSLRFKISVNQIKLTRVFSESYLVSVSRFKTVLLTPPPGGVGSQNK